MTLRATIDIEASGFNGYPIQVGVITESGETYKANIKPCKKWQEELEWNKESEQIHNLKLKDLIMKGVDIDIVARSLNKLLQGKDVLIETVYDEYWIELLFAYSNTIRKFNLFFIGDENKEIEDHWLAIFNIVSRQSRRVAHDALNDAITIQETYHRITEELKK